MWVPLISPELVLMETPDGKPVAPRRRSPEIVVAVLFEGGEHGQFAARIAAQVVKAYVEKQRRQPTKVAESNKKVEIGAVWNSVSPDDSEHDILRGGRFVMDVPKTRIPLAVAAPGVQ